jgi:hypothetical protein
MSICPLSPDAGRLEATASLHLAQLLVLLGHFRPELERRRQLLRLGSGEPSRPASLPVVEAAGPGFAGSLVDLCPPAPFDTLGDTQKIQGV